jgi:hypothetical protein
MGQGMQLLERSMDAGSNTDSVAEFGKFKDAKLSAAMIVEALLHAKELPACAVSDILGPAVCYKHVGVGLEHGAAITIRLSLDVALDLDSRLGICSPPSMEGRHKPLGGTLATVLTTTKSDGFLANHGRSEPCRALQYPGVQPALGSCHGIVNLSKAQHV